MTISEAQRHDMHEALRDKLGTEAADTLMEHLPPTGWADVATRRDLDHMMVVTRRDLDAAVVALRSELQVGIADVRTELQVGIADVRTEIATQGRRFALLQLATTLSTIGAVAAIVH